MGPPARRYVTGLAVLAAAAAATLLLAAGFPTPDPVAIALAVGVIVLAERTEVVFTWGRTSAGFTLIEVALTAGFLLLPPAHVLLAVVPAFVLGHLRQLATPLKLAYNLAAVVLGAGVAGSVLHLTPDVGPLVDGRPVFGILIGMLGYGAVSLLAFDGLLRRLPAGTPGTTDLRSQFSLTTASTLGTTAVGIVLAALWISDPQLVPFVVAPAAAVHLATRASVRATALLETTRVDHDRLVRVIDGASDGILLVDRYGTIEVWNPAMTVITGIDEDDAVGRPVHQVLGPQLRQAEAPERDRWVGTVPDDQLVPRLEIGARLTTADGSVRTVTERHARTYDDRGGCTGEVVVVRDVSREHELARLRSDFVARVSHELRTPLTPIRGFADVLLRRGDQLSSDERAEALTRIVERTDHLHALVEDLLLVTRLEHGPLASDHPTDRGPDDRLVVPRRTEVATVVRSAVDTLRIRHPARTVELRDGCPDDPAAPDVALADPDRTRQILTAVLDNAVRYTPLESPIEVTVERRRGQVVVEIRDHGPGVPAAERERIFERFHRLEDPDTMRTGGVGLGLFIARELARAMGGDLVLAWSQLGEGSSFELRLPVAGLDTDADADATSARSGPESRSA
ncbi:PAS domain-containing sensor histidine kinase [Nitriliruptoraceae bacterium ZYF776]|nr:PAS domain-containing sensor histidine kinase [Profundirhabdus halotolerans]